MNIRKLFVAVTAMAMMVANVAQAQANLTWDSNGTTSTAPNPRDGAGTWLNANMWWDGAANVTWTAGDNATIGNGGAGGAISLGGNVTAGTIGFTSFTGTYTIQGASQTLSHSGGITIDASAGSVTFRGTGATTKLTISGNGGITMNSSGVLKFQENLTLSYTGPTVLNGGTTMVFGNKAAGNFTLNNALLTDYYQSTTAFTSGLGIDNNQIQIYGDSGFGGGNGASTWQIGASGSTLQWGSTYFNPTTLKFLAPGVDNMGTSIYGQVNLDNKLDLNSGARTISVAQASGVNALPNSWAKIDDGITDSGSGGSLTKTGGGNLIIAGTSSYTGGTTISQGALRFDSIVSMPSSGNVQVNDGAILGIKVAGSGYWSGGASGVGTLGGLLAGLGGSGTSTVSYTNNVGLMLEVAANTSFSGNISNVGTNLAIYKIGASSLTLSGNNTFTGGTFLYAGSIIPDSANALGIGDITFRGGTLQYTANSAGTDFGSRIKNSASAISINSNGQNIQLSGMTSGNTGGLTKSGAGTLTFTGANTYSGATTLSAGTLAVYNGTLSTSGGALTFGAHNTTVSITGGSGVSSIWNLGNQQFGTAANLYTNLQVRIDGDGVAGSAVMTNVNIVTWGRTAEKSTILLTDGGQMYVNDEMRLGNPYYSSNGNANMTIGGGTATSTFTGNTSKDFYIGYGERRGAYNNIVTVSSNGVLTNIRDMFVGHVSNTQNNGALAARANRLTVTGTGIASMASLSVGYAQVAYEANSNVVEVTNGGQLSTTTGANYIGRAGVSGAQGQANGNTVTITGTASTWNAGNKPVYVGYAVTGAASGANVLTASSGGVVTNVNALIVKAANTLSLGAGGAIYASAVTNSGTLAVTIDGSASPACGRLNVTGDLNLSSTTLDVTALANPGAPCVIVSCGGTLSGTFAAINGLPSNYNLEYVGNQVVIKYAPAGTLIQFK